MTKCNSWKKKDKDSNPARSRDERERDINRESRERIYDRDNNDRGDYERRRLRRLENLDPFRSLFSDFDEFDHMQQQMEALFRQAIEGGLDKPGEGGPFVYGYSVRTGPDGKPEVREFGNFDPQAGRTVERAPAKLEIVPEGSCRSCKPSSEPATCGAGNGEAGQSDYYNREPLTDVIECDKSISVTIELPGIDKSDIELRATPESLTVEVDTPDRKFHKEFELPCEVNPTKIRATYKNGILDISLERKDKRKKHKEGKKINIE
ncbi:MAG: Hsp20/alpha crystallin family protein [Thermoplasmata archaeon]|nr:Hsp20/alpha crystallin family protein [Thermoplasmata archaeon]